MYLRIIGEGFTDAALKEVAALTDHAVVSFRQVEYDPGLRVVTLPIRRRPVVVTRCWGGLRRRLTYDRLRTVEATVVIRNVEDYKVSIDPEKSDTSHVTLLFGVTVKDHTVVLSSAEEAAGRTCYLMELRVAELDLEILDAGSAPSSQCQS